ncbi:MAG: cytidylate kinase-like family protein [Clostridia bacterium]|nr:cytidylate kinase-like family protein [Clostridia bacterium]
MSEKLVITIGRQYGSGGRDVGHKVAEMIGSKCYDQDLIVMAAKKSGISEEALARADEQASSSLLYTLAMGASMIYTNTTPMAVPINDALFIAQSEIIRELSETENCVIVGRCADYILKDHEKLVKVFVQGDMPERIARIMERAGIPESEAKDRIAKKDKKRANYYNYYTGGKWGKPDNYNLIVSTSKIGVDGAAKLIYEYAKALGYLD